MKQFTDGLLSQAARSARLRAEEKLWTSAEMVIVQNHQSEGAPAGVGGIWKDHNLKEKKGYLDCNLVDVIGNLGLKSV